MSNIGGGIFLGFFGLFWCSFVFLIDGVLTWRAVKQVRASSYATTTGTITQSLLKVESDSDGKSYRAEVHYRYEVNGQPFEGERIRYDSGSLGQKHSQAIVDRYRPGKAVAVHYDSQVPQEAVLELGLETANLAVVLFLTPFNAVAFLFAGGLFAWIRSQQLGRPVLGIYVRNDVLGQTIRMYDASPTLVALAAWGGAGFVSIFGYLLLTIILPMEAALAMGWTATLGATFFAWRYARRKYTEIRRDALRSRIELRSQDGLNYSVAQEDLRSAQYTRRTKKDADGDRSEKFPLNLPFFDPASQQERWLQLPEQSSEVDAKRFAAWLNGVLAIE